MRLEESQLQATTIVKREAEHRVLDQVYQLKKFMLHIQEGETMYFTPVKSLFTTDFLLLNPSSSGGLTILEPTVDRLSSMKLFNKSLLLSRDESKNEVLLAVCSIRI